MDEEDELWKISEVFSGWLISSEEKKSQLSSNFIYIYKLFSMLVAEIP